MEKHKNILSTIFYLAITTICSLSAGCENEYHKTEALKTPKTVHRECTSFSRKQKKAQKAEQLYLKGKDFYQNNQLDSAIFTLKDAEQYLPYVDARQAGLILFYLGATHEKGQLYHIALTNYKNALPYLRESNDSLCIACCLRDIGRCSQAYTDSVFVEYYDEALLIAQNIGNTPLYYDILLQKELNIPPTDTAAFYSHVQYACDSLQLQRYAYSLCRKALLDGNIQEAEKLLNELALDTTSAEVLKKAYFVCENGIRYAKGEKDSAYYQMYDTYLRTFEKERAENLTRTYLISRMYDVEQEKNKNLELQLANQRRIITIIVLLLLLVGAGVVMYTYRTQQIIKQEKMETEIQLAQEEIARERRTILQTLRKRIQMTKQLNLTSKGTDELPTKLKKTIEELTICANKDQTDSIQEVVNAYEHILHDIQQQYPDITKHDKQYIALALLGLNIQEIAIVLQVNHQSVLNRRTRLKQHTGEGTIDLDKWIDDWRKKT